MTQDELVKKIKQVEKKIEIKRKKNVIFRYNAGDVVHQKQMEFHRCLKRNRWVFGGNRSGKTECGAVEAVWRLRGIHPYRENKNNVFGWVVSPSFSVSRDVAQSKILHYLNPDWIEDVVMQQGKSSNPGGGVIDYILVKNVFGGVSKLGFKSSDQGRIKFQGTSLDFVWFDEEPPMDIYDECRMRVLDKKGDIFGTMTPLLGLTFVYNRIYLNDGGDNEIWHTFMEWADNPYLDKNEIEAFSFSMSEEALQSRRYGKFINNKGLVYSEFDENIHIIEPFNVPKEWYDNLSIDPGLNNPLSCHWYAVDGDGNIYVMAEHYEKGQTVDYHAGVIKSICDNLGWHRDSFGRVVALIDSAASQRTLAAEKSVVELFLDEDIQVNPKVDKNLFSGISRVKQYLKGANGHGKLYIFKTCINLIREIKSYWWGDGDIPKKKDDHALDELRYYIMSRPESFKPMVKLSMIEKDKRRLSRELIRKRRNSMNQL
ncbi:MAG: terminase family protein [Firmicutes bacterium]|nr:terminase family protein [Bacillota bacterium]